MKFKKTITQIAIHNSEESPIYGYGTTTICIEDEGAGWFIALKQSPDKGEQEIRVDYEELELILAAAKELISQE